MYYQMYENGPESTSLLSIPPILLSMISVFIHYHTSVCLCVCTRMHTCMYVHAKVILELIKVNKMVIIH